MGTTKKPRKKYRPKPVLQNPVGYVLESMVPIRNHDFPLVTIKIKNHGALTALTRGHATRKDIDTLITMVNIVEALYRLGFGADYTDVVNAGLDALHTVAVRGATTDKFILRAKEMLDLNTVIELHDAQMDVVTVKDMEQALRLVEQEYRAKKMRPIVEKQV
jgi:hypothetical protein